MADRQIIENNEQQQEQPQPPQPPQQPPVQGVQLPYPGFRFDPTDHELVKEYLEYKTNGIELPFNPMYEVNIYEFHPRDLTEQYRAQGKDNVWYFFTLREKKYKFGNRPARNAGNNGYWKATGADVKIRDDNDENKVIGLRKSLKYFEGRQVGTNQKTEWMMHEYQTPDQAESSKAKTDELKRKRHAPKSMRLDVVLCKIYFKKETARKKPADKKTVQVTDMDAAGNQPEGSRNAGQVKEKKAATRNRTPRVNNSAAKDKGKGKGKGKGKVKADDNNNQIELPLASEMNNINQESNYNTGNSTTTPYFDGEAGSFGCYDHLGDINFNNPTPVYSGGVDFFEGVQQFTAPAGNQPYQTNGCLDPQSSFPHPPIMPQQQQPFLDPSTSTSLSSYSMVPPLLNRECPSPNYDDANYNNGPGMQQRCFNGNNNNYYPSYPSDHDMVSFNNGVVPSQQLPPMPGFTNVFAASSSSSSSAPDRLMTASGAGIYFPSTHGGAIEQAGKVEENNGSCGQDIYDDLEAILKKFGM
ncbi:NAC transcription factor 25-like [Spinacia oleracea]|uniref:NAC transcription factor 25-like n=1 Tax=Spinacia oleracea TaxID=3562 RepID=A0A9R0INS8_SPIOL|nr:NAC transcription factor 25-like [Spinacia oleracea]